MDTKYPVGIDISKNDFKACVIVLTDNQETKVKASRTFSNTPNGFERFKEWYGKHFKENLPAVFVMEATGSYQEHLAWFLYEKNQVVNIVLPNRAKAYMASIGAKAKMTRLMPEGWPKWEVSKNSSLGGLSVNSYTT